MFEGKFKRRNFIQGLGVGALAASLGGCANTASGPAGTVFKRPFSRQPLLAPKISMNNIITQVVGHRPYRPEGFVVRSEVFGGKTLVHNYGHGGGGISLSWGSSALAVSEVKSAEHKEAAIIGSGVMGLTTARLLQEAGWKVTIYTKDMARHTTSQVAGGEWGPYSVHDPLVSSDTFKLQLQLAAKIAHETFARMVGADYGIQWMELYSASNELPKADNPFRQYYPFSQMYGPNEHPFPTTYCTVSATMLVETSTFLRRLIQDVQLAGGEFVIRNFNDQDELQKLTQPVIFNCTGLGSRALFGDEGIMPAKGQLILLPPDPAVDYLTVGGGSDSLYMFSRNDYMILGGTFKPGDWSTEPEPEQTERIIHESQQFFSRLP
ncbi:FAD-dependent oxidoreductase [uncultured Paraglaciecola sp.]|uniref:FAD-dependent oxidoreductase n=1 Tax=uncultured Paraglaciecola sp. TaxID=1765024 RepID=UPI0030DDD4BA|tara:strand:+ start:4589 stop:5725 length:1137 start_codon:yes stop_codon:yes gene_type:complete